MQKSKINFPVHFAFGHEFVSSLVKLFIEKNDKLILSHEIYILCRFFKKSRFIIKIYLLTKKNNLGSMNYHEK